MSCGDIVVRIQQGGTCWFNASLNGWLLSDAGRKLLVRYLNKYKNSNNYKKYANINACPMRGRVPLAYLWSYIDNALKPPTQRQINAYNNAYLIENAKLRELRKVNQITNLNKFLISATNNNNSVKNRIKAAGIQSLNNLKGKNEAYLKSLGFKTIPARLLSRSSVSSYLNLNVKEASRRRNTSGGTSGDDYYLTRTLFKDIFVTLTSPAFIVPVLILLALMPNTSTKFASSDPPVTVIFLATTEPSVFTENGLAELGVELPAQMAYPALAER
jgi:hypothetical protein